MSWSEYKLDELGYVSRGRSRHRPRDATHLYNGSYPFIQTGDVKHSNLYITDYSQTYSDAGLAQSRLWQRGTLCITIAANIADTAILDIEACFPDSIIGFIPDKEKADARFIKYLFDALLQKKFKVFSQGATQDNLSQSKLLSLKFPVPKIDIQHRIADILSTYDSLIENNRRRIKLLEDAARLLYKEWFVHLRFPGHEHVKIKDGVPEGWEKTVLGSVIAMNVSSYQKGTLPDELNYVDISSVEAGRILTKSTLRSADAPGRARRIARHFELLDLLKREKLKIDQWREKESTRDSVRLAIKDFLWNENTGLPVGLYDEDDVNEKAEEVYRHVYRAYPRIPSPYYEQSGMN